VSEELPTPEVNLPLIPMVTRFEATVIRIARYIYGQFPRDLVSRLVTERMDRPDCLSTEAINLVKDTFAKGSVLFLVRNGGWRRDRFLGKGAKPVFGRLWERSPLERLSLKFSAGVLDFLMWLTAVKPKEEKPVWQWSGEGPTMADHFFLMLAYDACRAIDTGISAALQQSNAFSKNPLCRLLWAGDFDGETTPPDFAPLFKEPNVFFLEALQPFFETRWLSVERSKGHISDWGRMNREGHAQYITLQAYMQAASKTQRWDLGRFVLGALSRLFGSGELNISFWTGSLQNSAPLRLADRLNTQRSALALPRQFETLRQWEQTARRSGFMDDDHELAKFFLAEWERYQGSVVIPRAETVVRHVEPLRAE